LSRELKNQSKNIIMRVIRDIFLFFYDDHVTNERERKRERERERLKCTLSSSFLIHHLNTILHFAKYYIISIPFFTRMNLFVRGYHRTVWYPQNTDLKLSPPRSSRTPLYFLSRPFLAFRTPGSLLRSIPPSVSRTSCVGLSVVSSRGKIRLPCE
jgi:hypothetical protein